MQEIDFPYPKINRPKMDLQNESHKKTSETFDLLEQYKDAIKGYIFTDIKIVYDKSDGKFILSRIQQVMSSALLRSLYIRNGMVDAINSRNMVALFANLKSFMEVPAMLAYLYSLIDRKMSQDKLLEKFSDLVFGGRGESQLRVGTREIPNVLTMFKKLDGYIKEMRIKSTEHKDAIHIDTVMSDFYETICNASHPNYDAHDVIGGFDIGLGAWIGWTPVELREKILKDAAWYTPSLTMTIVMIETLIKMLNKHEKVKDFQLLDNTLYFR